MRERLTIALLVVGITAVSIWLAQQLVAIVAHIADVLLVFLFAWALAYLLFPVVTFAERRLPRLQRIGAVLLVYVAFLGVLVIALVLSVPVLTVQLQALLDRAPEYGDRLGDAARALGEQLNARGVRIDIAALYATLPDRLAGWAAAFAADALALLTGVLTLLLDLTLVLVVAFFMLLDGDRLWRGFVSALPDDLASEAELFRRSADRAFGGFLRGQLLLGLFYGAWTWIVLVLIGLPLAGLLGVVSGMLMIIPFFGAFIALVPPLLVAATQSAQTLFVTFLAILLLQNVMLNVVAPRLLAETVGIHPLFVFLALLLGARVAGFWGVFLALPLAGILNVFGQYFVQVARGQRVRRDAARLVS